MRIFILYFGAVLLLAACKTEKLYPSREYQLRGYIFSFEADNSYKYKRIIPEGYILEFSRGTWRQQDKNLLLVNEVSDAKELPIAVRTSPSNESDAQLVITVLPKKNLYFPHLPATTDLLNIELVMDEITYPLRNETNIIRIQRPTGKCYIRAYPKPDAEKGSEILNDTLRSKYIDLNRLENKVVSIDADCNPMYFAQTKMRNDTLRIINSRKIKWHKMYLERPKE